LEIAGDGFDPRGPGPGLRQGPDFGPGPEPGFGPGGPSPHGGFGPGFGPPFGPGIEPGLGLTARPRGRGPFDLKVVLGERLFFDPRLSGSGRTACATCHNPRYGWTAPLPTTIFDSGKIGPRNAPSLIDVWLRPYFMWDGRYPTLEAQVFGPIRQDGEMGSSIEAAAFRLRGIGDYNALFGQVFHAPPTPAGIAEALAAYERTIRSGYSRFDRFYLFGDERALSPAERVGFDLFIGKGRCAACHRLLPPDGVTPPIFTDFRFRNTGVGFVLGRAPDEGLGRVDNRREDLGKFRTPPLRNVAITGPYMHDGSLRSLSEVIEFYDAGGGPNPFQNLEMRPLGLAPEEKVALVEFLKSLTSEELERQRIASQGPPH
jgi:cytochrome c peroxidase